MWLLCRECRPTENRQRGYPALPLPLVYTRLCEALVCSNRRRAFVRTFDGPPNLLTLTFHWNTATRHLHYPTNT